MRTRSAAILAMAALWLLWTMPLASAQGYDALFARLLADPDNPELNKAFAREAEARGELRHAFAALERIVTSSPGDTEAQAEFDRLRKKILPAVTNVTVQVGASYTSNPLLQPGFEARPDDATFDATVGIADERTVAGLRWRTRAVAHGQFQADLDQINFGIVGSESGPVFQLTPELWMHIASGAAYAWLDGRKLFDDVSASVTFGGLYRGLTQTVTARHTWRDGSFENFGANEAQIIDLEGRFVFSPSITTGDLLYLLPHVQISRADGDAQRWVNVSNGFFSVDYARPLFPGDYTDAGGRIAYYFPIDKGRIIVGGGVGLFHRWYDEHVDNIIDPDATGDRRDLYVEPTAHVILPDLIAPNIDLRLDYRFEGNYSNDATRDYENHVAGVRFVGRF